MSSQDQAPVVPIHERIKALVQRISETEYPSDALPLLAELKQLIDEDLARIKKQNEATNPRPRRPTFPRSPRA